FARVREAFEDNNAFAADSVITPVPADLKVTSIEVPAQNDSGEPTTIRYTVTNVGTHPVWAGTPYWRDFIWLSADDTFIRERASFLGETAHVPTGPLNPGASYQVTFETTLPQGTDGTYYVYIHLDAHNDLSPLLFPFDS